VHALRRHQPATTHLTTPATTTVLVLFPRPCQTLAVAGAARRRSRERLVVFAEVVRRRPIPNKHARRSYCEHPSKFRLFNGKEGCALYSCKCKALLTCRDCPTCRDDIVGQDPRCVCPVRDDCTCGKGIKTNGAWGNRVCVEVDGKAVCQCVAQ
jgi:hypothetical protein